MESDQIRTLFESVAYRMVCAGWISGYGFTADSGHSVQWRPEGAQKAMFLKDLAATYELTEDDAAPLHFHHACKGIELPDGVEFSPIPVELAALWQLCVSELRLEHKPDGLLGMVHIVAGWGPSV